MPGFSFGGRTGERVTGSSTGSSSTSRPVGGMSGGMSSSGRPGGMSGGMSSSGRPSSGMSGGMSSSGRPSGGMLSGSSAAAPSGSPSRASQSASESNFLRGGSATSRPTSSTTSYNSSTAGQSTSESNFLRGGSATSRPTSGATSYSSSTARPSSPYSQSQPSSARPSSPYRQPSSIGPGAFFKQSVPDIQRRFDRSVSYDKQQFMQLLREVGPEYEPIGEKLFQAFDKDRNGRLSANELTGGMTMLAGSLNKTDKMNLMFDLYDRDRSGTISRMEMSAFMQSMCRLAVHFVDAQVRDLSNLLTGVGRQQLGTSNNILADMQRQLRSKLENHTQMIVERAFGEGRARGGQLSKAEFSRWAQTQPKMFKWLTDLGKKMQNMMKRNEAKRYDDSPVRRQLKNVTHEEVRQITRQVVQGRVITQPEIRTVLERLNLKNRHLMTRLISVFDRDQRGEIATHEFFSSMAMLCSSSNSRDKLDFAFRMFDSGGHGTMSKTDVESFVNNFFKMAKSNIRKLIRGVNDLFPGAHDDDDRQFGRSIQQLTDTRIREFIDRAVEDAMRHAQPGSRSLQQREFMNWCGQMDGMSKYLEEIGERWLDSIEDDFLEGVEDSHQWDNSSDWPNQSDRLNTSFDTSYSDIHELRNSPSRGQQQQQQAQSFFDSARGSSPSKQQQAQSFFDSARGSSPSRPPQENKEAAFFPDGRGWKFSRDDYPRRYQKDVQNRKRTKRPKAQWHRNDHLRFLKNWDIRKISEVFMREARGGAMTYQAFCNAIQRLGVRNEAIAKGMFGAFDVNNDGSLALEEFISGIQVLTAGSHLEKVRLAFEVFDRRKTGRISRSDLQQYLKSFYRIARETISRVTSATADIFGVACSDQQVFFSGGQNRDSFGRGFAQGMDRHLERIIEKMTDDAFRNARDGYEGGGNLSLADFERWAGNQPNLIAWYEHLGDHWLSAIHNASRSSIQNYRGQRKVGLQRAFQETDLVGMLRDVQRRTDWYNMGKRDFEDMIRHHVRTPSMGIVDKLFCAFDVEDRGKVDGREVLAGICCLAVGSKGGHSDHQQLRTIFDIFDKDKNGRISRQELLQCLRSFFMLAYDVVHNSLLNCSELFGAADEFITACYDQINRQTEQLLERVADTILRSATGGTVDVSWSDFERWMTRDTTLVSWMAKVADLWCTSIVDDDSLFPQLEEDPRHDRERYPEEVRPYPNNDYDDYYSHYDKVQRGYGKNKKNKYRPPYFLSGPLAPVPGGLGAMGYPYQSYLKKIFSITLISHRTNHKKFTYRNPYAKRTCFSLHSSNPNIIEIKQPQLVIPPNSEKFARLTFHPASPGSSECLLYIHNDDADRNEECIRFDLSYMKDATNPYDKFAGLYGAKTYWGYDGADTGEDPFEARMWDNRPPPQARPPPKWDGYVPDSGGFGDRRPQPDPWRPDPGSHNYDSILTQRPGDTSYDAARKEQDFFDKGAHRVRNSGEFRPQSQLNQQPSSPDKFFHDAQERLSFGKGTGAGSDLSSWATAPTTTAAGGSSGFFPGSSDDARERNFLSAGKKF